MLEAMACGLPIVTSGAGGVKGILGTSNHIVNINDKESFVKSISELIREVDLMQTISKHNIAISKSFSWMHIAKKIDDYIVGISKL